MPRRQVLVQLDDELVDARGALLEEEGASCSELIRRAVRAWLEARLEARWEREQAQGYRRFPEDAELLEALTRMAAEHAPAAET